MNIKRIFSVLFIFIIAVIVILRINTVEKEQKRKSVLLNPNSTISASIYPLYFLSSEIAGENIKVKQITPSGTEPHDFELSPQDIAEITNSEIVFLIGGIEPWANKIPVANGKPVVISFIDAFNNTELINDKNGQTDPHIWISPKRALIIVQSMRDALVQADPNNKDKYNERAKELYNKISDLDNKYSATLKNCVNKSFITSHNAFSYLAKDYGLTQVPIAGLSPEEEPSAKTLADLKEYMNKLKIKTVFVEELGNPEFAQVLAKEAKAQIKILTPIEGLTEKEETSGETYLSLLNNNLNVLKEELICD